jgi:hypothetical protein
VPKRQVAVLTEAELDAADAHCGRANETLRRTYPPRWMNVRNLLRRSWYVVAPAHSCYAISSFKDGEVDGMNGMAMDGGRSTPPLAPRASTRLWAHEN